MNLRILTRAIVPLAVCHFLGAMLNAKPLPADKDSCGWIEVPVVVPGSNYGCGGELVTCAQAAATEINDKVVVIDGADGSTRFMVNMPEDLKAQANHWQFAENYGFIRDKLVVVSASQWLGKIRIDELDVGTGTWLRNSTTDTVNGVTSVNTPVLNGNVLTLPTSQGVTYRWDEDDWTIVMTPLQYSGNKTSPVPAGTIPLNQLNYSEEHQGLVSIRDPKRMDAGAVNVPYPHSGYRFAGATAGALWLYSSFVQRDNGRSGSICRLPLDPVAQVVAVTVDDARARESDGTIRFKVSASPAPVLPVSVELETRSGSAIEGVDYQKWSGSVVLTAEKPSAEVSIGLVNDQELEWCETFTLAVKNLSNAWCLDREAVGVIRGTSFARTARCGALPDGDYHYDPKTTATPAGLLAMNSVGYSGSDNRLFFLPAGTSHWEDWTNDFPFLKTWSGVTIEDVDQNLVCFVGSTGVLTSSGAHFAVVDASRREIIAQGDKPENTNGEPMMLSGSTMMGPAPSSVYGTETHALFSLPDLHTIWKVDGGWDTPFRRTPEQILLKSYGYNGGTGYSEEFQLRSFSDGSVIRSLPRPLGADFDWRIFGCEGGVGVFESSGRLFFHHILEDGSDTYQSYGGVSNQMVAASSQVFFTEDNNRVAAIDTESGAVLDWIDPATIHFSLSADQGDLIVGETPRTVVVYATRPAVPCPVGDTIAVEESAEASNLKIGVSEAVSYPLSVRLIWSSSSDDIKGSDSPVVVPPGSLEITLPFSIVDDDVPERQEKVRVVVEIAGNGQVDRFPIEVTIAESDILRYGETIRNKDRIPCSSFSLGDGAPFFGYTGKYAAFDVVKKSVFQPTPRDAYGHFYGQAVVCSKAYAVVGSPAAKGSSFTNFVYIYDRKKKSQVRKISHDGINTAFGAVLHLEGKRLFVGAPGMGAAGEVEEFTMPGGKSVRHYKQPGKARAGNRFGISIASDAKSVWIGAPGVDHGVVYQFDVKTGELQQVIRPEIGSVENFGHSLVFAGPYLAVGAPSGNQESCVFLYRRKTGGLVTRISSPFKDGGHFGASLACLKDDALAIGCPHPAFSKSGAILVYDLQKTPCRMLVMLEPSLEENQYHYAQYGWAGLTGSLGSYGGFLGIRILPVRNPLSAYEGNVFRTGFVEIIKLRFPRASGKSMAVVKGAGGNVWSQASACSADGTPPRLVMSWVDGTMCVLLPEMNQLSPDAAVFLEQSEDLRAWNPVACIKGTAANGWQPLSAEFQLRRVADGIQVQPPRHSQMFFRLRCVLAEPDSLLPD